MLICKLCIFVSLAFLSVTCVSYVPFASVSVLRTLVWMTFMAWANLGKRLLWHLSGPKDLQKELKSLDSFESLHVEVLKCIEVGQYMPILLNILRNAYVEVFQKHPKSQMH